MRHTPKNAMLAGATALLLASGLRAGEPGQTPGFDDLDHNADGLISYDEARRGLGLDQQAFSRADYDADDRLSRIEFDEAPFLAGEPPAGAPQETETEPRLELGKTPARGGSLMVRRAEEIKGMEVDSGTDDELGEVSKVVIDPQTNRLYAVVSVGGFMGAGERHITLDLRELRLHDDRLIATGIVSEDQLKQQQAYEPSRYRELADREVLGQAVRAQPGEGR